MQKKKKKKKKWPQPIVHYPVSPALSGPVLEEDGERLQPRAGSADADDTKQLLGVEGAADEAKEKIKEVKHYGNRQKFIICH